MFNWKKRNIPGGSHVPDWHQGYQIMSQSIIKKGNILKT